MLESWITYFQTTSWENIGLDAILLYSRAVANITVYYHRARGKYDWLKWIHNQVGNIARYVGRFTIRHKLDPDSASWGTIFQIYVDRDGFSADELSYDLLEDIKNPMMFNILLNRTNIRTDNMYDTCVIVKTIDSVMCRRIGKTLPKIEDVLEESNVRFLSVEYTHPDLDEPIPIKLPKEYWHVGNELFSAAFVLRYLEYQPTPYTFDEKYVVVIMDGNMEMITLKCGEYIYLEKNKYDIMSTTK